MLDALKLKPQMEVCAADSGYSIDIVCEFEDEKVGVEVDGPQHFLWASRTPSGATLLKRRQLQQQGWQLLPVPHWEFEDADNKHAYLMGALSALLDPHARAYRLLGVTKQARWEDVRAAYLKAAMQTHPDQNPGWPPCVHEPSSTDPTCLWPCEPWSPLVPTHCLSRGCGQWLRPGSPPTRVSPARLAAPRDATAEARFKKVYAAFRLLFQNQRKREAEKVACCN